MRKKLFNQERFCAEAVMAEQARGAGGGQIMDDQNRPKPGGRYHMATVCIAAQADHHER